MPHLLQPADRDKIQNVVSKIDFSNALVPNCTAQLLEKTCDDALRYGFAAVAVFPDCIEYVAGRLKGSKVNAQIATGFPCGNQLTEIKLREAQIALETGAREVDMVMNLHHFACGDYAYVEDEVRQMVALAGKYGVEVKLIIESGFWDDQQKLAAGKIAVDAGAAFIKTCTGFGPGRATVHDIGMLLDAYGSQVKIKASGGITSLEDAASFVAMGASRSAGRQQIVDRLEELGWTPA